MHAINSTKNTNYHAIAALSLLTITAIATTIFIGMNHWQVSRCRHTISNLFSKNLALRAAITALVGSMTLITAFGITAHLSYRANHLKKEGLPETAHEMLKKVMNHNRSFFAGKLKEKIDAEHFKTIMQMIINDPQANPLKILQKLSKLSLDIAEEEYIPKEEAEYYLKVTDPKQAFPLKLHGSKALGSLLAVVGNIIGAVGIADLFKSAEDEVQASFKAQKILMLVSLLNILIAILIPTVGARSAGLIIGCSLGGITLLSIIWPYIKPIPAQLPGNAQNLTNEAIAGKIKPSDARQDVCDRLHQALMQGKHVMLIGPSRTGKTMTLRSFVEKVTRGEYPGLHGKVAYYWNTADLAEHTGSTLTGGTNNPLTKIASNVGSSRNMNSIIFCFDEMHSAMLSTENSSLPDQMKTALDEGGVFKHVVGITTTEEFERHIAPNKAFAKRFVCITVENMDKTSTIKVLSERVLRNPDVPLLGVDVLEYIIEKSTGEDKPQPHSASNLLDDCITKLDGDVLSKIQIKITETKNKISALLAQAITSQTPVSKQLADLRTTLEEQKSELQEKQTQMAKILRAKSILRELRKAKYEAAKGDKTRDYSILKAFEATLITEIEEESNALGIRSTLTKTLVDEVLRVDSSDA